jgi:bifunctional DNA primase/polymerase-like protein
VSAGVHAHRASSVAENPVLGAALEYRELGWSVLPLKPGSKEPNHRVLREIHGASEWRSFSKRPPSAPEIRAWFKCDPSAGLGILTGTASGGLVVADVDGQLPGRHPATPTVKTGRGWHLYAQARSPVTGKRMSWGDLKGDGGYIVAPPSLHPAGSTYSWAISPSEAELVDLSELRLDEGLPEVSPRYEYPYLGGSPSVEEETRLRVTGDALAAVEAAVSLALPVLGIAAPLGQPFRCVIPGHNDRRPSASIFPGRDGVFRYRDWHAPDGREWWSLAEVRAAQISGRLAPLSKPSAARWYRRLFAEAGLIDLAEVSLPPLPVGSALHVERVRAGFELLLRLRDGQDPGEPMPFTRRFAVAWCGVSEDHARNGIAELKRLSVIEKTGEHLVGGRAMHLYRPGAGPSTLQRRAVDRQPARGAA